MATGEPIWDALRENGLANGADRRLDDRLADMDRQELAAASPGTAATRLVDAVDGMLSPFTTDDHDGAIELYVGHSLPWRFAVCRALDLPPAAVDAFVMGECSVTVIDVPATGLPTLHTIGSQGHLPPAHMSVSLP
jgi:broad specificity phosphatase PhoE